MAQRTCYDSSVRPDKQRGLWFLALPPAVCLAGCGADGGASSWEGGLTDGGSGDVTRAADTDAPEADPPEADTDAPEADPPDGHEEELDPGGIWAPPGMANTFVVNPTWETESHDRPSTLSYLPGCIDMPWSEACASARYFMTDEGESITLEQGVVLSLRFRSDHLTEAVERFQLASGQNNGNLGWTVVMAVSTRWADFAVDPKCIQASNTKPQVQVSTDTAETRWVDGWNGPEEVPNTHCVVSPDSAYYVNLRFDTGCSPGDVTCRLRVQVPDGFR